jgi:ribose/xylose/arabinose/galactoside ABC-type transport system permease subunit
MRHFKLRPETLRILCILIFLYSLQLLFVPRFATSAALGNVLGRSTLEGMLAAGATVALLMGQIDLSIGSTAALATALAVGMSRSIPEALVIGALVGVAAGLLNSVLVVVVRINSFIATLGTMIFLRGATYLYTGGQSLTGELLEQSLLMNLPLIGPIAPRVVIMLVVVLTLALLVGPTRWGLELKAIGGDQAAARAAGVPIGRRVLLGFVLAGLAAGVAGGVQGVSLNGATPYLGSSVLLPVLTAVVIGGTSLLGGKGSVIGSLLGVLTLSTLAVGLNLLRIEAPVQQLIIGSILLTLIILERAQDPHSGTRRRVFQWLPQLRRAGR